MAREDELLARRGGGLTEVAAAHWGADASDPTTGIDQQRIGRRRLRETLCSALTGASNDKPSLMLAGLAEH